MFNDSPLNFFLPLPGRERVGPPKASLAKGGVRVHIQEKVLKIIRIIMPVFFLSVLPGQTQQGNLFVYSVLRYDGNWDPYPGAARDILMFLEQTTSVDVVPERRVVDTIDAKLFESPFLVLMGSREVKFTSLDIENLRRYIEGGGMVLVDDTSAVRGGPFEKSIKRVFTKIIPGSQWEILPKDHAVFRSFFLLRTVGGRKVVRKVLEAIVLHGRSAVIYSSNDINGAWAKDRLGKPLLSCEPGGEPQRWEALKLTINIILYSITGSYKTDAIHQPFIERKLR